MVGNCWWVSNIGICILLKRGDSPMLEYPWNKNNISYTAQLSLQSIEHPQDNTDQSWGQLPSLGFMSLGSQIPKVKI